VKSNISNSRKEITQLLNGSFKYEGSCHLDTFSSMLYNSNTFDNRKGNSPLRSKSRSKSPKPYGDKKVSRSRSRGIIMKPNGF
jgi:hypothetical protein